MESVYFVREEITGFWLCHGPAETGFPKEGDYHLEPIADLSNLVGNHQLVCGFDADEVGHHLQAASELQLLRWHPGDKKVRAQLKLKKVLCAVFPPQVKATGIRAPLGYQFIHADKGPFTYYVIREDGLGLYLTNRHVFSPKVGPFKQALGFAGYREAKSVFDRIVGKYPDMKDGPSYMDRKWRIEKRQGFVAKGANPRMTSLLSGEKPWYQSDFVLVAYPR